MMPYANAAADAGMRVVHLADGLPEELRGSAVAVGNFDGVHRGHRAVIGEAGRIARAGGLPWTVLTFEPHPRGVLRPDQPPFRLTPVRAKARAIGAMGVQAMIVVRFDPAFSRRPATSFVEDILADGLGARHVVCGYDFVFGHNREGDSELLLHLGCRFGFSFTCVQQVCDEEGRPYSATRVREHLTAGDTAGAARILGRPFELEGPVEEGDRRGRTIGFPTANVRLADYLQPALGVYAVRAGIDEGPATVWRDGVVNLGHRPTFGGNEVLLESHLFDFDGDLYDRHLRVQLIDHLRAERTFDGIDALRAQIAADAAQARRALAAA